MVTCTGHIGIHEGADGRTDVDDVMAIKPNFLTSMGYHIFLTMVLGARRAPLSTFTQIFEQCIYNQLINYIKKHKIIFQFQFGFRKGHSTAQAITEITNTLRKAIDDNL